MTHIYNLSGIYNRDWTVDEIVETGYAVNLYHGNGEPVVNGDASTGSAGIKITGIRENGSTTVIYDSGGLTKSIYSATKDIPADVVSLHIEMKLHHGSAPIGSADCTVVILRDPWIDE